MRKDGWQKNKLSSQIFLILDRILDRMVRNYYCKWMIRRWPVALFYDMIDVSPVNAYTYSSKLLHSESNQIFSKKKRKFLICLGKELAGISSTLSMQKKLYNSVSKQQKKDHCNRKPATKAKNKNHTLFLRNKQRSKCSACNKNIRKLFAWIAITNRLKAFFSSFLNTLKPQALIYSIEKPYVLAFVEPIIADCAD